jgi:hypothetical protein
MAARIRNSKLREREREIERERERERGSLKSGIKPA